MELLLLRFLSNLRISAHFNQSILFLLSEQLLLLNLPRLLISLRHLVVKYFFFFVLLGVQLCNLSVNHLLSLGQLFLLPLFLALPLLVVEVLLLLCEDLDALILLAVPLGLLFFLLDHESVLGCDVLSALQHLQVLLLFLFLFRFHVFGMLLFDELPFKALFLVGLDVLSLKFFELLFDIFHVLLLLDVVLSHFNLLFFIEVTHFLFLDVAPSEFDFPFDPLLFLPEFDLFLLFLPHVTQEHLRLQGFHHVLVIDCVVGSFRQYNLLLGVLINFLFFVNFALRYLIVNDLLLFVVNFFLPES